MEEVEMIEKVYYDEMKNKRDALLKELEELRDNMKALLESLEVKEIDQLIREGSESMFRGIGKAITVFGKSRGIITTTHQRKGE